MAVTTAIVPIAGWGTRLLPISQITPKEFLPLGDKPAIQHIAEELAAAGICRIVFVASPRKRSVVDLFSENPAVVAKLTGSKEYLREKIWSFSSHRDVEIEIAIQNEQLGLGHAVLCAEPWVQDRSFVVALGDCLIGLPGQHNIMPQMLERYVKFDAEAMISFQSVPSHLVGRYGIAKPKTSGAWFELEDLIEKPSPETAPSNLAVCGRYIFSTDIFETLRKVEPGVGGEIQLTDAIRHQIRAGQRAYGFALPDGIERYDVGDVKSYTAAFIEFALANDDLRHVVLSAIEKNRPEGLF